MHPYRPFPSPATPNTHPNASPSKQHPSSYGFPPAHPGQSHPVNNMHRGSIEMNASAGRHTSAGSSRTNHPDYSESESDGDDDKLEKDKLELRREKNRVKQRNLRLRRANHIAELEKNLSNVRAEHASLQSSYGHLQQRENSLQGWVHDLESALFRNGLAGEVETLRRIWADRDAMQRPRNASLSGPSQGQGQRSQPANQAQTSFPTQSQAAPIDPLSTLARAAASTASGPGPAAAIPGPSDHRRSSYSSAAGSDNRPTLPRPSSFSRGFENPYPTPDVHWGSQMNEWMHMPDADKKRKRDSLAEYGHGPGPGPNRPTVHPMSGRMSESNIHTLPPIQPYSASSPSVRPLSAPYNSHPPPPLSAVTHTSNTSPKSIRISDLLSPRPSFAGEPPLVSASTSMSSNDQPLELKREIEKHTTREGGWNKADSSPEQNPTPFAGTKLPPLRFIKVEDPATIMDRKRRDQDPTRPLPLSLAMAGSRAVSPKTRIGTSLSPSTIATHSPLLQAQSAAPNGGSPTLIAIPRSA